MKLSSFSGRATPLAGIFLAFMLVAVKTASAEGHDVNSAAAAVDDGWRRTPNGWERIDEWQIPLNSPFPNYWRANEDAVVVPVSARLLGNLHPGLLALAQMALVGGALAIFPATANIRAKR